MLTHATAHPKKVASLSFGLQRSRQHQRLSRTPLVLLVGLCISHAAAAESLTFDGARAPSDYTDKLLTIRSTPKSLGPIQRRELGSQATSRQQEALLNQRHSRNTISMQSGTVAGSVYGAAPAAANTAAAHNTVSVTGGQVQQHVYGAYSSGTAASAHGNQVTLAGGQVSGALFGAYASGPQADAADNSVTVTSGTLGSAHSADARSGHVYGGYSANGTALKNKVHINGKDVNIRGSVFGGASRDSLNRHAQNNSVTITAGTVTGQVVGGIGARAAGGLANGNTVLVDGEHAHIQGEIRGGTGRNATHNIVHIRAGTIAHDVIGGYNTFGTLRPGTPQMLATGNTLVIEGQPQFAPRTINGRAVLPSLYGGFSTNPDPRKRDVRTGNTLHMRTHNIALRNVHNFERIHFYLPANIAADAQVLTLNDAAGVDLSRSQISVELPAGATLKKGQRVQLIHASAGPLTTNIGKQRGLDAEVQTSSKPALAYTFRLSQEGNSVFATVVSEGRSGHHSNRRPQAQPHRDAARQAEPVAEPATAEP